MNLLCHNRFGWPATLSISDNMSVQKTFVILGLRGWSSASAVTLSVPSTHQASAHRRTRLVPALGKSRVRAGSGSFSYPFICSSNPVGARSSSLRTRAAFSVVLLASHWPRIPDQL